MKQNREAALRRELEERGTLPAMPDADELKRRAKAAEPLLTIWEQNAVEGLLLAFKSAHREAYAATQRVYRFPDDIRLAAARLARLAEAHGDDADKGAAGLLQGFFANPGGTVRTAKLAEANEARIAAQILLDRLADACKVAFAVAVDSKAERAARELRGVFDTAKGRKDAMRAALGLMGEAAAQWLDEAEGRTLAAVVKAETGKIRDTQAEQGATLGRIDANAATAARMANGLQNPVDEATAAALCGVTTRTIRNWNAGKGTPRGWPGLVSFEAVKTFADSFTAFRGANQAIQRNPARYNPNLARHNPQ